MAKLSSKYEAQLEKAGVNLGELEGAGIEELIEIDGIGKDTAKAIVKYYKQVEEERIAEIERSNNESNEERQKNLTKGRNTPQEDAEQEAIKDRKERILIIQRRNDNTNQTETVKVKTDLTYEELLRHSHYYAVIGRAKGKKYDYVETADGGVQKG